VAFVPGDRAVTGSYDGTLKLWHVSDGAEIATLTGHQGMVETIAVSPRDGSIASGSRTGELLLWDGKSGDLRRKFETQDNAISRLRFSPDGNKLLTTVAEGKPIFVQKIWDVESGRVLVTYKGHDNTVGAADISPDQGLVATAGGKDNEIHLWDIKTEKACQQCSSRTPHSARRRCSRFRHRLAARTRAPSYGGRSQITPATMIAVALTYRFRLARATGKMRAPERLSVEAALDARRAQQRTGRSRLRTFPAALTAMTLCSASKGVVRQSPE
jgi:WD40 repeat protein